MVLGSLRYDKLFDYGDQLADPAAKKVLNEHFGALAAVGETLAAINARRKAAGQLTYPYLSPDWLPNGIQTWARDAFKSFFPWRETHAEGAQWAKLS